MNRSLALALAGAGSLAWVLLLWAGPVLGDGDTHPLVQDADRSFGFPIEAGTVEDGDAPEAMAGNFIGISPGGASGRLVLGGGFPEQQRARLAQASLPGAGTMDSRSRLLEPPWFSDGLLSLGTESAEGDDSIMPAKRGIPEPAALLLLGSGFLALAACGRKWIGKNEQ